MDFIIRAFQGGGPFMFFILLFSVLTLGLIIERGQFLFFKVKLPTKDFRQQILDLLIQGDYRAAEMFAQSQRQTCLGRITSTACRLLGNGSGQEEIQARMDDHLSREISWLDRRTGFLAMFGNVSTLLGLLGTIVGMIHSFAAVAGSASMDRATLLSKGISEAMNCTAFGLIVAIPALVAYAYFQNKTDLLIEELSESTAEIFHDMVFLTEPASLETPTEAIAMNALPKMKPPELDV